MNGVPIILSLRVDDGMGDTERRDVEAFVTPEGHVIYSDGRKVGNAESKRPQNRREVTRGKLQAGLNELNEKLFALNSGMAMRDSSPLVRAVMKKLLFFRVRKLERAISYAMSRKMAVV